MQTVSSNTDDDRDRGILSPVDREYLRDPDEFSRQGGYQRRDAIRTRVEEAFFDFRLLLDQLDDEAIKDVFAAEERHPEPDETMVEPKLVRATASDVIAFLARISLLTDANVKPAFDVEAAFEPFTGEVGDGIETVLAKEHGLTADIEVTAEASDVRSTDDLADELRARDDITGAERFEKAAELSRAGYSDDEIENILGVVAD